MISDLQKNGINVEVLPGASAITTALVASGLPTDHFMFAGFLPRRKNKLTILLKSSQQIHALIPTTFIAFESPHRINKTLTNFLEMYKEVVQQRNKNILLTKPKNSPWDGIMDPQIKKQLLVLTKETTNTKTIKDQPLLNFCITRELTKKFSQVSTVTLTSNLKDSRHLWKRWLADIKIRGEFTLLWRWL